MKSIQQINNDPTSTSGENKRWQFGPSHIGPNGSYMRRWIFQTPWFTLRLHHILRSDADRHLHDHPWDFVSLILSGSYVEETPPGGVYQRFTRGMVNVKRATDAHRLTIDPGTTVWTVVLSGPYQRKWGFHTPMGWVYWREYVTGDWS